MQTPQNLSPSYPIKIVLSIEARLLRELLQRAFSEISEVRVVGNSLNDEKVKVMIEKNDVQWIVVDMAEEDHFEGLLSQWHPHLSVSILGVALDGSYLKLHWTEVHDQIIQNPSWDEVVEILKQGFNSEIVS